MNRKGEDGSIKEPIKLRFKQLKDGNQSIYLDCYVNGIREYKFLNLYLRPDTSRENKMWNKEQLRLANAIKAQYIIDIQNGEFGFKDRNRTRKLSFLTYCEDMAAEYEANGQTSCAVLMRSAVKRMTAYKGKNITFNHIDKEFLIGFIEYLNSDIRDFDKESKDKKRKPKPLSEVYKEALFARIMVALNKAERDGIIVKNPGKDIDRKLKPHAEQKSRCYLTLDEIQKIIDTEYKPDNDIKPAFLFCCFSGLRYSDVQKLTWGEITVSPEGHAQIETNMQKTGKDITIPLSDNALKWLPARTDQPSASRIFYKLPDQVTNADVRLRTIIKKAGITKHVTFHVARHTFATLTLTYGADLYTVSKLLGHSNIRTTQIYAKIVDESKRKAVNLIPKL
ncbi:MAG: site-specific integrase [Candidatus Cryptobacteroides sp.]